MHSGRPNIFLSEQGKDLIRLEFHKLIQEKVYPTSEKLLKRLTEKYEDFPIHSTSTLCKKMKNVSKILFSCGEDKKHDTFFYYFLAWIRISKNIKDQNCVGFTGFCRSKSEIFSDS